MSFISYSNKSPIIWYASGVIIFNHDFTKTIIVKTPKGNVGFPKGGKEFRERLHQTAHREVEEETGLKNTQYKHDNTLIGEKKGNSEKSNCTIYYFIAHVDQETESQQLQCCMPNELSFIEWVNVDEALKILCKRRSDILKNAHEYILEKSRNNTLDHNLFVPKNKPVFFKNNNYFKSNKLNSSENVVNNLPQQPQQLQHPPQSHPSTPNVFFKKPKKYIQNKFSNLDKILHDEKKENKKIDNSIVMPQN
jgi:8-oxo-dGTP pyrophosphatase MutT (NUDIX family)